MARYRTFDGTKEVFRDGIDASSGAADADKIIKTDSTGRIGSSLLPPGIGETTESIQASEAITAGDLVNVYTDSGNVRVRKADNSNGRWANGFALSAINSGSSGDIHFGGLNTGVTGGTAGAPAYLGTGGGIINAALDIEDAGNAGDIHQCVGFYASASQLEFAPEKPTTIEA